MQQYKNKPWTKEERQTLKDYYCNIPMDELLEKLPGRTAGSGRSQVYYLRKRGWTFNSVRRNYGK